MKTVVALVMTMAVCGCGGHMPAPAVPPVGSEDCPVILLARRGGVGPEAHSGVIAAVWASGRIVRADSPERPSDGHVVGRLKPDELAELLNLLHSNATWNQPADEVGLDTPGDVLTLQRAGVRRQWVETSGVTSTPVMAEFRQHLADVAIERAEPAPQPFELASSCR